MKPPVFLTGATGFLGMEVLARLVEAGDRQVVALVRPGAEATAAERLDAVLAQLWRDPEPYRDRVRAVAGDVTRPGLGIEPAERAALAEEVGAVLHCAASISFDLPLDDARAINVEGTREVIGFARECKTLGRLERFLHVSTAYVSGKHGGTFGEHELDAGQDFRNTYEQTKWEAEHIVREADDLAPAIARPSIVMGESDTGWTPAFNVLYWPLRAFSRGLFSEIPALPVAHVDIVPVDYVADALVHLLDIRRGRACSTSSPVATPRWPTTWSDWRATASGVRGPRSCPASRRRSTTSTAPSTSRTSTWTCCSRTPALARRSHRRGSSPRGGRTTSTR